MSPESPDFAFEKRLAKSAYNVKQHIGENLSTVCHAFVVLFTVFIIFLASKSNYGLFDWHPLCMTLGIALFTTEAILIISEENIFSANISQSLRVKLHLAIQACAIGFSTAGFVIIIINKNNANDEHFKEVHEIVGLTSIILMGLCIFNGTGAFFSTKLRCVKPKVTKIVHGCAGILAYLTGMIALILGLYEGWIETLVSDPTFVRVICTIMLVLVLIWTLVRPVLTFVKRIK